MALTVQEIKKYYDTFGSKQDGQGFYEDPPIDRLIEHGMFDRAMSVFEFGCGTGRLAAWLLEEHLPAEASYTGIDVSETMVALARDRLAPYGKRATVTLTPGGPELPLPDHSVDRVLSAYVLDLLPEEEIEEFFKEARRVLKTGGALCCASLTEGTHVGSKIVAGFWSSVYRILPSLVGGCRPILLRRYLDLSRWNLLFRETLTPFGVPSEIIIAESKE